MSRGKVLYVGGMGRSGSTLLERALSQLPNVCGVGESVYMWERGLVNDERCGCGESFSQCEFWTSVGKAGFGGWENVDPGRIAALRAQVDDVKYVPRMFFGRTGAAFESAAREYVSYYERLYAGVREVSGCDVVVDSSKITSLAYLLSRSPNLDVSVSHILRDPRAVAYAWTKVVRRPEVTSETAYMPRYSPTYMAALYSGHHVLLEGLRVKRTPVMNVRYEDFADDPMPVLRRTAQFAGLTWDRAAVAGSTDHSLRLDVVHTASGNPSRFTTGEVEIRRDEKWRREFSRRNKVIVSALTAPLIAAYGYARRTTTPRDAVETRQQALPEPATWPAVTVVVPTHNRPDMVRRAVASVVAQDYEGPLDVLVVFDKADPDDTMVSNDPGRPVRVTRNDRRTPGLAGARNTGILATDAPWVAFLDDDDHWEPDKLSRQVRALLARPEATFATTSMVIERDGETIDRLAGRSEVRYEELLRSRLAMLHSSSFLASREALLGPIGLVDETMPRSMAEDWDLLLRAAKTGPIVHLDEPLVRVTWGTTSYFADQWRLRNEARLWMIEHHPDLMREAKGAGLTYGKLAFGTAMLGERREAWKWARRALRANWREPRTPLALLVAVGLLDGDWIVEQLGRRGRGI